MPLTPVEIRHVELRRTWFRGYRRGIVERLLTDIADSFETVWRERADLADEVEELQAEAWRHKELEELLRSTLVAAERSARETRDQARRESDLIVQEAHAEGRRVTRATVDEKHRLEETIRTLRAQLRSALEVLDEPEAEEVATAPPKPATVGDSTESGIRRVVG